jgi:hypothetical protein
VPLELIQLVMGCVRLSFFPKLPPFNLLLRSDYVPCTTPLNMTITLDNRPEIPLHPLDLTAEPPQDNQAEFCVGLFQTADSQLSNPSNSLGDIILGVPFLRNVYTVMAYTAPDANGSFTTPVNGSNQTIDPRLGLLSLTDPTIALQEFYTVRKLKQPISGANSSGGSATGGSSSNSTVNLGGGKLSVGIVVLIGLLSFFALCCVLFAVRWFMFRRTYRKEISSAARGDDFGVEESSTATEFMLTKTISSKDEKVSMGFFKSDFEEAALEVDVGDEKILSDSGDDGTNVAVLEDGRVVSEVIGGGERGSMASGDNTLVQSQQKVNNPALEPDHLHSLLPSSSPPLRSQTQQPLSSTDPHSLARQSPSPTPDREAEPHENLDEFEIEDTSMAGIGTASRTSKAYLDSNFLRDININGGVMTSAELDDNGPSFAFTPTRA